MATKLQNKETCPLCGLEATKEELKMERLYRWECPKCQVFDLSWDIEVGQPIRDMKKKGELWKISAYCRKLKRQQNKVAQLTSEEILKKISEEINEPGNVLDAQDRVIAFLAENSDLKGSWIQYDPFSHLDVSLKDEKEMAFNLRTLYELEILDFKQSGLDSSDMPGSMRTSDQFEALLHKGHDVELRLTHKGWEKYDQIIHPRVASDKVFVAMWFDPSMGKLREAIKAAATEAGYHPIIVDEEHYADFIMDFVLASIQQSKFVIADFTAEPEKKDEYKKSEPKLNSSTRSNNRIIHVKAGVRGGVYFEAGFARGLGKAVIHCCKDNPESRSRLHFDIKQINTLFWTEESIQDCKIRPHDARPENLQRPLNFSEALYDRIVSMFGLGPLKKNNK